MQSKPEIDALRAINHSYGTSTGVKATLVFPLKVEFLHSISLAFSGNFLSKFCESIIVMYCAFVIFICRGQVSNIGIWLVIIYTQRNTIVTVSQEVFSVSFTITYLTCFL